MWPCTCSFLHPEVESECPPAPVGESRLGPAEAGERHAGGAQTWPFTEDLEGRFGPTVCFTRNCLGLQGRQPWSAQANFRGLTVCVWKAVQKAESQDELQRG